MTVSSPCRGYLLGLLAIILLELCPGPVTDADRGQFNLDADAERYRRVHDNVVHVTGRGRCAISIFSVSDICQCPAQNPCRRFSKCLDLNVVELDAKGLKHVADVVLLGFETPPG